MAQKITIAREPIQVLLKAVQLSRQLCNNVIENPTPSPELVDTAKGVLFMLQNLQPALTDLEIAAGFTLSSSSDD